MSPPLPFSPSPLLTFSDSPPPPGLPTAAPAPPDSPGKPVSAGKVDDLLNLDIDQLSKVRVSTSSKATNLNAPSSQVNSANIDFSAPGGYPTTTGELARQAPGVSTRRTSAVNLDPRVRGYHSGQLGATANGMSEVKTRVDIDSVLSQIDPGLVENLTVIDGPYTSLFGPGFAFLEVDLLPVPRYPDGPEGHQRNVDALRLERTDVLRPREHPGRRRRTGAPGSATACASETTTPPAALIPTRFPRVIKSGTTCSR